MAKNCPKDSSMTKAPIRSKGAAGGKKLGELIGSAKIGLKKGK